MFISQDGSGLVGGKLPSGAGQALALDSLGNLLVSLQDPALAQITSGQWFYGTTGQMNSASGTVDAPCSIFNPANSGKNVLITSIIVSSGTGSLVGILFAATVDPAYASAYLLQNANLGSAVVSVISGTFVHTNTAEPAGEFRRLYQQNAVEMIPNSYGILLPKGSAHGVIAFMETYATGIGSISSLHAEF